MSERITAIDTIDNTLRKALAIADLLASVSDRNDTVSSSTVRTIGEQLCDQLDEIREALQIVKAGDAS